MKCVFALILYRVLPPDLVQHHTRIFQYFHLCLLRCELRVRFESRFTVTGKEDMQKHCQWNSSHRPSWMCFEIFGTI
jgi:hypothetical protein